MSWLIVHAGPEVRNNKNMKYCNKNFLYFLRYKMCFVYKQTHTFYIYSRVSFQAWLPLYSTICSLNIYICICIKRVYPIFQDTFLSLGTCPCPFHRFHGPTPLIFFTMSAMRSVTHASLAEITKSLTRRRA